MDPQDLLVLLDLVVMLVNVENLDCQEPLEFQELLDHVDPVDLAALEESQDLRERLVYLDHLEVMDVQGRVILQRRVSGRTTSLLREDLGAGSYVLRLRNEQASAVVRFEVR